MINLVTTATTIVPAGNERCTRVIAFKGSREDALERLPSVCKQERLEFGVDRISLIGHRKRVDLRILAEVPSTVTPSSSPMLLLELRFDLVSTSLADAFIACLQKERDTRVH